MKVIKNSKLTKFLLIAAVVLSSSYTYAQEDMEMEAEEEVSNWTLSGTVDAYFRTNFNGLNKIEYDADGDPIAGPQAPASSFANAPGFALGMANVILGYEGSKVGFVADLVFGPRGEEAVFNSIGSSNIVNQLYVYYNVNDALTLTLGNWNTYLGYEVISPAANFNYSTSYMFSYGPFSHTGLKADFSFDDNWTGMLAIMNPTDFTEFNPYGKYSFGGQLGYSNASGSAFLNLLYGEQSPVSDDATFQIDLTTGWDLSDAFYLGFNTTYQDTDGFGFYGAAIYPQIQTSDSFAIGLRAEYFKELEDGGPVYGADVEALDFTLTGSYTVGNLIIKPELRLDSISEDAFLDSDLNMNDNLSSFLIAAIYAF
ncbi:outer membrane beta-barrel protein [Autumnicola psychrophila]|uniref:Outer membrane beta-barrel protein n=1 Tax=Autumnicola psychrophila TaxID=3075592 RepID=A0ABU3DT63_9FLAO|nr:outer membrane beta-barrel protein [Zunongwangia sp. F225]MDT0686911.1 outer membrane beta-barrel protein [Zunongwangia sp. F225]